MQVTGCGCLQKVHIEKYKNVKSLLTINTVQLKADVQYFSDKVLILNKSECYILVKYNFN